MRDGYDMKTMRTTTEKQMLYSKYANAQRKRGKQAEIYLSCNA